MDANLLHDIIFYVMYAALAIALVIIIERTLYFAYTQRQARRLEQALTPEVRRAGDRETIGDLIDAQYLLSKPPMARGLWLLETVVTAAPLLGLLGTVMGIIETFKALAASGVSEPSLVSAGMGTALYATGLGIAIALLCLVANNFLQSRMERINELLKVLLIRAGQPASRPESGSGEQWVDSGAPRYA
ncbi:MotA/TolQ/ExbB proton channel family protein [Serratia marcescens]